MDRKLKRGPGNEITEFEMFLRSEGETLIAIYRRYSIKPLETREGRKKGRKRKKRKREPNTGQFFHGTKFPATKIPVNRANNKGFAAENNKKKKRKKNSHEINIEPRYGASPG